MTRPALPVAVLLALCPLAGGSRAAAQEEAPVEAAAEPIDPDTEKAIKHFKKGVAFFEKEKYEAALVEFLKSHELKPNWALRYNIGICYDETGRPVEALAQFRLYLEEGGDKIPEPRRIEVEGLIATLEQVLGSLIVEVDEEGASISVGDTTKVSPIAEPFILEAGFHEIEVHKSGFVTYRQKIAIASGEEQKISVDLVEEEGPAPPVVVPEVVPPVPAEKPKKPLTWIWIGLESGAVLAAVAVVTGSLVLVNKKKMQHAVDGCPVTLTPDDCPKAYDYRDKAQRLKITTNVFWGLAGAAAVAGLVVFLASKPVAEKKDEGSGESVTVAPVVGPGQAGVEARVVF